MSIQAVAWALDQDLPARPKLVLVSIANHANHTDGYCWLKAETIAGEAACTPRSVYRFVGGLVRNGYLRKALKKGDDGKQRANDYWMLFNREDAAWDWGALLGDGRDTDEPQDANQEAPQEDAPDQAVENIETQDVALPHDTVSPGDDAAPVESEPVDKHVLSCGPGDSTFTRKNTAEPSKTNPLDARARGAVPRTYRPPPPEPPQPVGSIVGRQAELIFVYEYTRAYEAWAKVKAAENGINHWHMVVTKVVDGRARSGWYFPTLFPPEKPPPSEHSLASESELDQFAKTG